MNLAKLSSIINTLLADLQADASDDVTVESFQKLPKDHQLALRQAVGAELLQRTKETAFGAITPAAPPCNLIKQLLSVTKLNVIGNQGVVGKVLRGCFRKDCQHQQFAVKMVSFAGLAQNVKQVTLPQNYEVYVLNLLNKLLYLNLTPHIVVFYLSYICRCADYLPKLPSDQIPARASKLHSMMKASQRRFLSVVQFDQRGSTREIRDRYDRVLGSLQSILPRTELAAQVACVWAAYLNNECPTVLFPPVDRSNPWRFANFQTLITVALIFYPDIVQLQVELLAYYAYIMSGTQPLGPLCAKLQLSPQWEEYTVVIANCVQQIVTSAQWSARVKELAAVSDLLPVINWPVKKNTVVPCRLYNFYTRTTLTEWVQGGSLRSVIQRNWFLLTEEDYAALYFQYLYTMLVIQQQYPGFSHNDGHLDNILVAYEALPVQWPRKVDRLRQQFTVTALVMGEDIAVRMQPPRGAPFRFVVHGAGPFGVRSRPECSEYDLLGYRCYLPNIGYSVRLWDFDWSNINNSQPQNQKVLTAGAQHSIFADAGQYYDIYLFFKQVAAMRDSTNSNAFSDCRQQYGMLFPAAIHRFHQRVLGVVDCQPDTYESQRLTDTHVPGKYPTIQSIMQNEIKNGIFARFVEKPRMPCQNVYASRLL